MRSTLVDNGYKSAERKRAVKGESRCDDPRCGAPLCPSSSTVERERMSCARKEFQMEIYTAYKKR